MYKSYIESYYVKKFQNCIKLQDYIKRLCSRIKAVKHYA